MGVRTGPTAFGVPVRIALLAVWSLAACVKQGGEAVVIGKQHIAAEAGAAQLDEHQPKTREQWLVWVRMQPDGREVKVDVEQARWEALKIGDHVKASYSRGKISGMAWNANLQ